MADNFLEKQYDDYLKQKARREAEKRLRWQKQMRAYKKSQAERGEAASSDRPDKT